MSNLKAEALSELLQRFAVSALSRERKNEAVNEEILAGKYTGEFYIKSKDGVVVSADIMNRLKAATDSAIRIAELVGMTGELFRVDFDELVLPNHIDYSVNLIENEPIELPAASKDLLLNLDLDEYDIIGDSFRIVNTQAMVRVVIEADVNGEVKILEFEKDLQNLNYHVASLAELQGASAIRITSIAIEKDENEFNADSTDRTILLHNIFVTVNN